ncbi:hypothetical protein LIER_05309 [Lithospermum erythrorhizon]|uniref:Uncharacterized protein n=1 Tax=Lithospermum erythrorhizon TaxID=34254 RepID=A0AAV3P093_LITER
MEDPEIEENAEVFAANVLMEPAAEDGRSSKVSASKRRKESGEVPRRKSKKSKVSTIVEGTEGVEGHEEAPVAELGVKDSQTLEGFRNRTVVSVVAKSHIRHLRDHYSIHQKVLMRIPLPGETSDTPQEEGYTSAEDFATSAVDDFKVSQEYLELLKGNTVTLVRGFCQNVHADFPGISSHFDKYVSDLGEDYVVELFDDLPEDDDEDMGVDEDDEDEDSSDDARGGNGEDDVE